MTEGGLAWVDYVRARKLEFPEGQTWGDIPRTEYRRLTWNWRRWQRRRMVKPQQVVTIRYEPSA